MDIGLALLAEPRGLEARGPLAPTERRLEPGEELPQEDIEGRGDEDDLPRPSEVVRPDIVVARAVDLGQVAPLKPRGRGGLGRGSLTDSSQGADGRPSAA